MPDSKEKTTKKKRVPSPLVGSQAQPTVLDDKVKLDVDYENLLSDQLIAAGLNDQLNYSEINKFTTLSNNRNTMYQQLDIMFQDASVAAVARTYAQDVCEVADNGHIIWAESSDPKISKFVNYLLNVANIDKNIYGWTYSLVKNGDLYLKLFRESDYDDPFFSLDTIHEVAKSKQILNEDLEEELNKKDSKNLEEEIKLQKRKIGDNYSYYIEAVPDPSTMFELTKYGQTFGFIEVPNENMSSIFTDNLTASMVGNNSLPVSVGSINYQMKSSDIIIHQADDYVHAVLEDNISRFPETVNLFMSNNPNADKEEADNINGFSYNVRKGKSYFYDAYKVWREKTLLESSALLCRLTRSSVIQKVEVEVGQASRQKSALTLRAVKEMFENKSAFRTNQSMSEYTNPGPVINYIFQAVRDSKGHISVESIGGDYDPKSLIDLDWWNNKFYSLFGIPKQYFGWTDDGAGFNGGSALTILSSVYAKAVKQIQNAMIQAIDTAINLFLLKAGCKSYLNNFVLKMKAPVTEDERTYRENLSNRVNAISSMNSLFSDVETKSRHLRLLKELVKTLNYGDEITSILDEEIGDNVTKEDEAAKAAEEQAKLDAQNAAIDNGTTPAPTEEKSGSEDLDLNVDMNEVPVAEESFSKVDSSTPLFEDVDTDNLFEDILAESEDLPTPEDLDEKKDFTDNLQFIKKDDEN